MDMELEQKLRPQLSASERLLWSGRPAQGLRLRANDALMIPFSLLWCGFAIFWEYSALQIPDNNPTAFIFPIWGIPFVCIGLYLVVGRFFWESYVRGHTYYALTGQRALIVTDVWGNKVKSLPLSSMAEVTLSQRADGSGTITLGNVPGYMGFTFGGRGGSGRPLPPAFEFIPDAQRVYGLIRDAQAKPV